MEESKSNRTPIIVAIIGLCGVIATAVIANSDKIFGGANKAVPTPTTVTVAMSSPTPAENSPNIATKADAPVKSREKFLGALDGIYENNEGSDLTVVWNKRTFTLGYGNCAIMGSLVERDDHWVISVVDTDGMCSLIDDDDIGKEVGKITPQKGAISNSGRVSRALVNFDKAGLAVLSGVYEFKYNDIDDLRRQKGMSKAPK